MHTIKTHGLAYLASLLTCAAVTEEITSLTIASAGSGFPGQNRVTVAGRGNPAAKYVLEASPDLQVWTPVTGDVTGGAEGALFAQCVECAGASKRFFRFSALPVVPPIVPTGRLLQSVACGPMTYTTALGWIVVMHLDRVTITPPQGIAKYEMWGGRPHESLGDKHIKDLLGNRRTLLLPGDVILTFHVDMGQFSANIVGATVQTVSIYEGNQTNRFSFPHRALTWHTAQALDGAALEPDGETGRLFFNADGLAFENIYQEGPLLQNPSPNAPPPKVFNTVRLGQSYFATPGRITDYFDDPRLNPT